MSTGFICRFRFNFRYCKTISCRSIYTKVHTCAPTLAIVFNIKYRIISRLLRTKIKRIATPRILTAIFLNATILRFSRPV